MNTSQTLRPEERRAASDPSMTGSKALIESFLQEGVETVFGYPGGAIIPVYDALYDYRDRLRHILVRHEQGAVHAAQGYARVSGRVGVCLVTSGPGATNTVTGLADALMDSTPLVLVTGQVGSALLGTELFSCYVVEGPLQRIMAFPPGKIFATNIFSVARREIY